MKPHKKILIAMLIASPAYLIPQAVSMSTGKIRPAQQPSRPILSYLKNPFASKPVQKTTPDYSEQRTPVENEIENKPVKGMEYQDYSIPRKPTATQSFLNLFKSQEQIKNNAIKTYTRQEKKFQDLLDKDLFDNEINNDSAPNLAAEETTVQTSFAFNTETYGKKPARIDQTHTLSQEPHQLTLAQEQSAQRTASQISSTNSTQLPFQKRNALQILQKNAATNPESARTLQILQEQKTNDSALKKLFDQAGITDTSLGNMRPVIQPAAGARNSAGALTPPPLLSEMRPANSGLIDNTQTQPNTPLPVNTSKIPLSTEVKQNPKFTYYSKNTGKFQPEPPPGEPVQTDVIGNTESPSPSFDAPNNQSPVIPSTPKRPLPLQSEMSPANSGSFNNRQPQTAQTVGKLPLASSNPFDQEAAPANQQQQTKLTATTTATPNSLRERFQLIQDQTSNLFRKNTNIRTRINDDGTKVTELFEKTDIKKIKPTNTKNNRSRW